MNEKTNEWKFQALSLSEKKDIKKIRQGGKFTTPPACTIGLNIL